MIAILGAVLGFISSTFPSILLLWKDKTDKKHELDMMDRQAVHQLEMQKLGYQQKLAEIEVYREANEIIADAEERKSLYKTFYSGIKWVDAYNAMTRPNWAHALLFLYIYVKWVQTSVLPEAAPLSFYIDVLWTEFDQAMFATIGAYYFGDRAITKAKR